MSIGSESTYIIDDHQRACFRVRRDAFTDPAVLDVEHKRIFEQSWLYVGHVSEIPTAGTFVSRTVGGRAVILVRDQQGEPRVFMNACAHRGNAVCREKKGKTARFTCFYHAWSYDLSGRLVAVPDEAGYGGSFDKSDLPLPVPARIETYRGLVFLKYTSGGDDLVTFLGNAKQYLDYCLDVAGEDLEIVPGTQSYSMRANWKLLIENSIDVYHAFITHKRYFDQFVRDSGLNRSTAVMTLTRDESAGRGLALGNGHALIEMPVPDLPVNAKDRDGVRRERERLEVKFGAEGARTLLDTSRNLFIFPNLVLVSNWRTIRTFYPITPDYMEIDSWALLPKAESAETRQARLDNFISFLGPAGFGTPDDVEALEGCQKGFYATPQGWSDISRGMTHAEPVASDEQQMRGFWRQWLSLIEDRPVANDDRANAAMRG